MFAVLLSIVLASASSRDRLAAAADDQSAALQEIVAQRFAANAANDRAFYERLLAPNFMSMEPYRAPVTKQQYLEAEFGGWEAGYRGARATVANFRASVSGDTAVVSYDVMEPTPLGGIPFESHTTRLDTYVRLDGAWHLLAMAIAERPAWPPVVAIDSALYRDYAGTYRISPEATIVISVENGHLMARMTGQGRRSCSPKAQRRSSTARTAPWRAPSSNAMHPAGSWRRSTSHRASEFEP